MRRWTGPASAVAIAVAVVVGLAAADAPREREAGAPSEPFPTDISSNAPRFTSLEDLVVASDLVVRGRVVRTGRGRTFGDPGATVIESRLVIVEVDDVLHHGAPAAAGLGRGSSITVEEPGWLEDGTPVSVDGVPPTVEGDELIWFLVAVPSPALEAADDAPGYVLVGPQGHYAIDGAVLVPAEGDDGLADSLATLGRNGLVGAIRRVERALVTPDAP